MHYLSRIKKTYYFRLRIPLDMRHYFNQWEIKRSLRTTSYTLAKSLVKKFIAESERIFTMIRSGVLTDEIIKKIVEEFVDSRIELFEKIRNNEIVQDNPYEQKQIQKDNERLNKTLSSKNRKRIYKQMNEWFIDELKSDLALRKGKELDYITDYVNSALKQHGISTNVNTPEYNKLCNEMLKGSITIAKVISEHEFGNYDTPYDINLRNRVTFITFEELIKLYEKDKEDSWKDASRIKTAHRQLLHIIGDIHVNNISRETTIYLSQALKQYPKKLNQKDMSIPWEELSKRRLGRLSDSTQHYILTAYSTLIKYGKDNDLGIKGNPAKGIADKKPINKNAHKAFTTTELQNLITALSKLERDKKPENFWIPLILLYTGARANEICMLRCEDIEKSRDIWTINFRNCPEHHQRTKNHKDRQAPVHNQLIKLGFIDYLENLRTKGQVRLFDNLKLSRGKWNVDYGKCFNRTFKRKFLYNYTEQELSERDLHSFRKTMISWFTQNPECCDMMNISILQSIIGHFERFEISKLLEFIDISKLTTETYGGGYGQIIRQNDLLQRLDYGIDVTSLMT